MISDRNYQTFLTRKVDDLTQIALLTKRFDFGVEVAVFGGIVIGPHRLGAIRKIGKEQAQQTKKTVIMRVLAAIENYDIE